MSLSIPEVAAAVAADFVAYSITAEVLFGDWQVDKHAGAPHVIFGLGPYARGDEPNAYGPGPVLLSSGVAAVVMTSRIQTAKVWVHAVAADPTAATAAEDAHRATATLLDATLAALCRVAGQAAGGSMAWGAGAWPVPERGEYTYGALTTFQAQIWIPVLDRPQEVLHPLGSNAITSITLTP